MCMVCYGTRVCPLIMGNKCISKNSCLACGGTGLVQPIMLSNKYKMEQALIKIRYNDIFNG